MTADLLIIVPTRSRPEAVGRVINAWCDTGAFDDGAELVFVVDDDDPRHDDYRVALALARRDGVSTIVAPEWRPLVPKLNRVAVGVAVETDCFALGFAGDDHLPRTVGWAKRYVETLRELGTGIVYCDDGYQHENIPTQWAMTGDIVRALGAMVPAEVEHLYCDNAVRDLGVAADCLRYLPDVLIEHMHPAAEKAATDAQYDRVNSGAQRKSDRAAYRRWQRTDLGQQAARLRALRRAGT